METSPREQALFNDLPPDHIARFLPDVDFAFIDGFKWDDPVWGNIDIDAWAPEEGEANYRDLFRELLVHPAIRRLIGIEQLTLTNNYATLPNAARFSRWEHATGSAALVSKLADKWNKSNSEVLISSREKTMYILRALLSDIAHTFGSHIGDWIELDTTESAHDKDLLAYLSATGVTDILARYGIEVEQVCLTEISTHDFVENLSPNLCVDRVDYGVREIHRTNPYFWDSSRQFTIDDFELERDDNNVLQIVMKDSDRAILFAKAFELLPKEDWSEPLQRLQTTIYMDLVRMILVAIAKGECSTQIARVELPLLYEGDEPWIYEIDRHPRDVMMYTEGIIDQVVSSVASNVSDVSWQAASPLLKAIAALDHTMRKIAEFSQAYFESERRHEIESYTSSLAESRDMSIELPDRRVTEDGVWIVLDESSSLKLFFGDSSDDSSHRLTFDLPGRKKRGIKPKVKKSSSSASHRLLSDYKPNYDAYEHKVAHLIYNDPEIVNIIRAGQQIVDEIWPSLQSRKRISSGQLQFSQRFALQGLSAAYDYWKFTRAGALIEEEDARYLAQTRGI